MTWATPPHQNGTYSISMVATKATDLTPPVNYFFDFIDSLTGGSGGTNSGWQSEPFYNDSELKPNHQYGYRVKAKNGLNNQTAYSPTEYAYTAIKAPIGITFGIVTSNSIQVQSTNTPSGLDRGDSGLRIENRTNGTNSGWKRKNTFWTSKSLSPNKRYNFRAKARNGDGIEADYSPSASKYTLANPPGVAPFSNITNHSIRVNWTANGNPSGTQYFCQNVTNGDNSGWITNTYWEPALGHGKSYSFRVRAKNKEDIQTGWTYLGKQSTLKAINFVQPSGAETIPFDSLYDIQWDACSGAQRFDFHCSLDSGATWKSIAKEVGGTDNFNWQVPNVAEDKNACLIRVIGYNATRTKKIGTDKSNNPFTIEK
jgi:uncharacterized protein YegP (UPF0339 family)